MKSKRRQIIIPILIILFLSLLIYSNTLLNGFTYDDTREIVNNSLIQEFDWGEFVSAFFPGAAGPDPPGRAVPLFTFAVNYGIGGLNPAGYHLVNVVLHALISLLIYAVGRELFPDRQRLSFLVAALFACHPVHADVVAAAVGRSELISSFCFLLALLIYLRKTASELSRRTTVFWWTIPIVIVGVLSKATAATLPLIVIAFDLYRFTLRRGESFSHGLRVFTYRLKKFYLAYIIAVLFTLALYAGIMPAEEDLGANFLVFLPFGERIIACLGILTRYIAILIWPFKLSADYSFAQLSYQPQWIQDLWTAGGIVSCVGWGTVALVSLRRKGRYFLAVFIFAVNYAIISNIILVINVSMAERLVYMASWGFCLALGFLLDGMLDRWRDGLARTAIWLIIVSILGAYSVRTWTRNRDWKDNFTLFSAAYAVNPMGARVNYNLGLENADRGNIDRAVFHYENAVRIIPWNPLYRVNLGEAYARIGEVDKAIEEFQAVVLLEPEHSGGFINLGGAYKTKGMADQAIESLMIAREIDPDNWRIYFNLGDAYLVKREYDEAARSYERLLELNPDHWQAWNKLGAMYMELGTFDGAIQSFNQAIAVFPEGKLAYNNLGLAYAAVGERGKAGAAFRHALEIDPGFVKARNNLNLLLKDH
ncbi:MAG: tetratricopeptide repeat protein [Candidatus Tritonobacter lacicola]|nr:tetratricopeptide repeat protein [Candidatus Tritonobacter lacicola]